MIDAHVEMSGAGTTSLSLLARVRANDEAAWTRLVNLYGPVVYGWCVRAGLRREDAADVGQDVFGVVVRKIQSFRRDRAGDSFRGWLFRITQNKVRDRVRAAGARGRVGNGEWLDQLPADPLPDPDESSVRDDRRRLIQRAIEIIRASVEERTWRAFWRLTVDDQPADAVAAELGMTREAVYLAKSRVLRRLRAEFGELLELGPAPRAGTAEG